MISGPLHESSLLPEFLEISSLEFLPPAGLMAEPLPQIIAGSNLLEPLVDRCPLLLYAAGPKAIDKNSVPVSFLWLVLDSFRFEGQGGFPGSNLE